MLPKWHILFGAIFSLILYLFLDVSLINSAIVFLASVLIDFDHYLFIVKRNKDISLKKAYIWHKNMGQHHKPVVHIFHTVEFLVLIFILSLFSTFFLFILIGMLFHSIFDLIELGYNKRISCREYFLTRYLLTKDKSKYL